MAASKFLCSCHNPNSISTQPQLSWVWHDYGCPHPPTPPGNFTSTRNNGPSDLKFCMRPHLTNLTTTQLNFNPTIFFGGGMVIHPPPSVNPTQFLSEKNILWQKSSRTRFFLTYIFFNPNFFWHNIFLTQHFFDTTFFWHNFFDLNFFLLKIFLTANFCDWNFFDWKFLWLTIF